MGLFKSSKDESAKGSINTKEAVKNNLRKLIAGEPLGVTLGKLFNAALLAATNRNYTVFHIDRESHSVTFQTTKGEKYWDGKLSVTLIPMGGGVRLLVSGNSEQGSGSFRDLSPLSQLASDGSAVGERKKFELAILEQLEKTPEDEHQESVSKPVASPTSDIATQIMNLKALLDSGVLNEEEFIKAKAKLLGS